MSWLSQILGGLGGGIGDLFGGGSGGGSSILGNLLGGMGGGAMGTGGPFNFNVPPQPSQNIAWSMPDPYANYQQWVTDTMAGLYPGIAGQFSNAGTLTPDQQAAYDAMIQATSNLPAGYGNAMDYLTGQLNNPTSRPDQYAPYSNTLQNNAANLFNDPRYATGATQPSLDLLQGAQQSGAGQGQQSLMNALYGQAMGGNQTLGGVQNYLSQALDPNFATAQNPQVKTAIDAIKAQQQQLLDESRGRTLLDQNMYGAIPSSGTAGQLSDLERKFNLDMSTLNSQAMLNQLNTQQQLQQGAANLGTNVSQIPANLLNNALGQSINLGQYRANLLNNALGQGINMGQFQTGLIPQLQDIYNQQGNRAGQQFGIGQQLWGNQMAGLQNQWNQYNQGNQNAMNAIPLWSQLGQMPTQYAQNQWTTAGLPQLWQNQQQNQYGALLGNMGQFGGQGWQQPTGYVYNQPPNSNWYDPFVNQATTNLANWGWGQLGNIFGGGGNNQSHQSSHPPDNSGNQGNYGNNNWGLDPWDMWGQGGGQSGDRGIR